MFKSFARGMFLKLLGLVSKAGFLIWFAPRLSGGEFAEFFVVMTGALVAGRLLGMGADDELPFKVKGQWSRVRHYFSVATAFYLISLFPLLAAIGFWDSEFTNIALGLSLSILFGANAFSIGSLRSISNAFQETRANVPWVIVFALCVFLRPGTASDLLAYLLFSYWLIFVVELLWVYPFKRARFRCWSVVFPYIKGYAGWFPKALSTAGLILSLRSLPVWLLLIGVGVDDAIAYAFAMGEIVFQVCMTLVNVIHSDTKKLRSGVGLYSFLGVCVSFIFGAILISGAIVAFLEWEILEENIVLDPGLITSGAIYCATIAMFSLLRVLFWQKRSSVWSLRMIVLQLFMFGLMGILTQFTTQMAVAVVFAAAGNCVLVLFTALYAKNQGVLFSGRDI